ncbi:MAG TPA: PepSY domain-containing protein [Gammaproteobacteria bacterium]
MARLRRFLIVTHRWLGIPLSAVFVLWFASGIVMMYAGGMPQLTPETRLARLPPLDLEAVRLTPAEAAERAGIAYAPERATLVTVLGRPAYRFDDLFGAVTVFADDGAVLEPGDAERSRRIAAAFLDVPVERVRYERTVTEPDQWTLTLARDLPLHKLTVDDGAGTEVYVSPERAEVRLVTTARTRALAWAGTIPHWFYITPLRTNQPLWYWTVVALSGLGCVLAVLGLALGVTQFRPTKPFNLWQSIRYRGWMRWHYLLGVVFGVFALTWVFSGLLSMEPFEWTRSTSFDLQRTALAGGPLELERFPPFDARRWEGLGGERAIKEIELARILDAPYYIARYSGEAPVHEGKRERLHQPYRVGGREQPGRIIVAADTLREAEPFDADRLVAALTAAVPDAPVAEHTLLHDYDSYYYSRGGRAPLPVLRVKFADPLETWVYVDPAAGDILAEVNRYNRLERWLYNGLHSLDFAFWYDKRPLWDVGLIVLSLGGLAGSAIGLWLGLKRLRRDAARLAARRRGRLAAALSQRSA